MRRRCFTLIELLVVVAIIALLVGILLPALTRVKQRAIKVACSSNLKQVGNAIQMYLGSCSDRFPAARYMPLPFVSSDDDPPLPDRISEYLAGDVKVFHCPGDNDVFKVCGSSFTYNNSLSGRALVEMWFTRRMGLDTTEVPVAYDCDGYTFTLTSGEITVPWFHLKRNLLFADWHVGNYQ